ncbi:hypothetical protein K2173_003886 [Erythroxylum novogranatense]|uniref:Uncharacterized protein n=1 Tax=Erythroxylum novogranatense TaxID=1862640 RepID=A0AAV8SK20_9ROSI|nr:hypothetical protein K2173_003886 [Erythroxylum novogranatense]
MGSLGTETAKEKAMWLYPKIMGSDPSERWGHSACYSNGSVYVFGGCCGGMHFSDVLKLNLETMVCNTLTTSGKGPGPRDSHSAVLVGHKMIVFGGTNGSKKVNDLHMLDLVTKEWISPECKGTPPSPRESHTATLIGDAKMVIFGGSGEGEANYLNDVHVLDLKTMTWSPPIELKGDIPVQRDSHSAVAIGNQLFVYGGDRGDRYHGGVDVLDMDKLTWTKLHAQGSSPGVRAGHTAVNIGNKIYIVGGVGDKHYYNDIWILESSSCSWTQLHIRGQQPQGRFSHTAVVADSGIIIYGGCGEDERPLSELLILHLEAENSKSPCDISLSKFFGSNWKREKRRARGIESNLRTMLLGTRETFSNPVHDLELESRQPFQFHSESPYPKRKRTMNYKGWDIQSELEKHSVSTSQHSSPSQSDQEPTPARKAADSLAVCQGLNLFTSSNNIPRNCQINEVISDQKEPRNMVKRAPYDLQFIRENKKANQFSEAAHSGRQGTQYLSAEQKHVEAGSSHNLIGAEVRGKVDGAFDSGLLMTATIDGMMFRGVLFPPAHGFASRGTILAQNAAPPANPVAVKPFPNLNQNESSKASQPQMSFTGQESSRSFRHNHQKIRAFPGIKGTPSFAKDSELRSDLQGVVLTLGGPGNGHVGQT